MGQLQVSASVRTIALCVAFGSALLAGSSAHAADGQFQVGVVVLPSRPAPGALSDLPVPDGARALTSTRFGGSYQLPGDSAAAVAFYRASMQQRGYRLARSQQQPGAASLVWERSGERVQLDFQDALGRVAATRLVVSASATGAG